MPRKHSGSVVLRFFENNPEDMAILNYIKGLPKRANGGTQHVLKMIVLDHLKSIGSYVDENVSASFKQNPQGILLKKEKKPANPKSPKKATQTKPQETEPQQEPVRAENNPGKKNKVGVVKKSKLLAGYIKQYG